LRIQKGEIQSNQPKEDCEGGHVYSREIWI